MHGDCTGKSDDAQTIRLLTLKKQRYFTLFTSQKQIKVSSFFRCAESYYQSS